MKRQNVLWITVTILIVLALFTLGFLAAEDGAAENPRPVYSLSPGVISMIAGPGYVSDGANFQMPEELVADAVQRYLKWQNYPDLVVARQLEFSSAYQVEVIEESSGHYAYGLMVGKDSGQVSPKAGPNIFWNIRYGPDLAEIGGGYGMVGQLLSRTSSGEMTVTESDARSLAEKSIQELDDVLQLDGEPKIFYGFYQFDVSKNGEPVGELAVNGYSRQVWYESWGEPLKVIQNPYGDR